MTKIVLITGASRGIGAACARLLARQGYAVAINYAGNSEAAATVAADILNAGGTAIAVKADVADPDAVETLFQTVDRELGPLTHLVNNAGVITERGRFEDMRRETVDRMLAVNVKGYVYPTQQAIRRMSTRHGGQGGVICNISSGSAHRGSPNNSVLYAMTKGAVNSLTIGLSQELVADGIRVNTVSPGLIATDMPGPDELARRVPGLPMKRAGTPEEIAQGVAYLLSDAASYTSGANLRIAGGLP
ncbi:MAG: SDR family oxidoreductase [Alphaproteobacteria bacterium]|nr:SDR family oxidoreductase [Alphaproteobacteria bacterium]MCB9928676.1 SDR family oxidoreductase [Alphaproteobacteria bacterium]